MGLRFAAELRQATEAKGYSMYRVAKLSGVNQGFLCRMAGGHKVPGDETIVRLAQALDWPVWRLAAAATIDRVGEEHLRQAVELLGCPAV